MKPGEVDASRRKRKSPPLIAAALAAGAAALLGYGAWTLTPSPADLHDVEWVVPSPRGDWIAVSGRARGHRREFLIDLRSGAFLRLPWRTRPPVLSENGGAAAWTSAAPGLPEPTVTPHTVPLDDPRHHGVAWETRDLHVEPLLVFSPSARRLAVIAPERIVVWDMAGGRMLAAAAPPQPLWGDARGATGATFAGEDRLRIFAARSRGPSAAVDLEIIDFDVLRRRLRPAGHAGTFRRTFPILASPDRSRLLIREGTAIIHLLDGETGRRVTTFSDTDAAFRSAGFLSGGVIALFESAGGVGRLRILAPEGAVTATVSVGRADRAWILGEPRAGMVMLATASGAGAGVRRRVLAADLSSGRVEEWAEGLIPASPYAATLAGDPGARPSIGSLATRLFFTERRELVTLDGPRRVRTIFPRR